MYKESTISLFNPYMITQVEVYWKHLKVIQY